MISDYISNSLKNIRRNKKNVILIIIFTLLFLLLFLDVIFIKNFNDYFDYAVNNNVGFRTLSVRHLSKEYDETSQELRNINHVMEVIDSRYESFAVATDLTFNGLGGWIGLRYGTENIVPKSLLGKNMKDLQSGELICPYNFYPDSNIKIDDSKILNPKDFLDYEFTLFYDEQTPKLVGTKTIYERVRREKKFKIVGVYDNTLVMSFNNECYAVPEDVIFFNENLNPSINNYSGFSSLRVVIDKRKNVDQVREDIKKMGYEVDEESISSIDGETYDLFSSLSNNFFIIVIISIFLILIISILKRIKNEMKYIGILRSCGYTKKQIMQNQIIENLLMLVIGISVSYALSYLLFVFLNETILTIFSYLGYTVKYSLLSLCFLSFFILIFSLFVVLFIVYIKVKNSISENLMER